MADEVDQLIAVHIFLSEATLEGEFVAGPAEREGGPSAGLLASGGSKAANHRIIAFSNTHFKAG